MPQLLSSRWKYSTAGGYGNPNFTAAPDAGTWSFNAMKEALPNTTSKRTKNRAGQAPNPKNGVHKRSRAKQPQHGAYYNNAYYNSAYYDTAYYSRTYYSAYHNAYHNGAFDNGTYDNGAHGNASGTGDNTIYSYNGIYYQIVNGAAHRVADPDAANSSQGHPRMRASIPGSRCYVDLDPQSVGPKLSDDIDKAKNWKLEPYRDPFNQAIPPYDPDGFCQYYHTKILHHAELIRYWVPRAEEFFARTQGLDMSDEDYRAVRLAIEAARKREATAHLRKMGTKEDPFCLGLPADCTLMEVEKVEGAGNGGPMMNLLD